MNKFLRTACIILIVCGSCSSERDTFVNRNFHNLTSRYNAFYLADLKITEVITDLQTQYKEDYTQVLPVFIPLDSSSVSTHEDKLKSARELASKAIDWHRISKWVDDSYYLLGKIDYLEGNYDEAQNTFKYVNVKGKDKNLRHQTLISLLKLYVDLKEYEKANFTIDYLSKETEITEKNRYQLYLTLAHYYESRADKNGVIGALQKVLDYKQTSKETSRINFILAQYYQAEGLDAPAYSYYIKSLEGNPPYERSFYAQLYAQQVAELNASKDFKKVRNYYENLYKNPKNQDLKDVVVYEMALFEEKQNNISQSIDLLHQAAKETGTNPRLKGYIYQKLAELHLAPKKDYRSTKYYLDSALNFIKETDPIAKEIKQQKETLDQYVIHVERIIKNDSLIQLASLSIEEQTLVAEQFIQREKDKITASIKPIEQTKNSNIFDNLLSLSSRGSGSSFYFDNLAAMQQGTIDFNRVWGNRTLQDNWRRTNANNFQNINVDPITQNRANSDSTQTNPYDQLPDINVLLSNIPTIPDGTQSLNQELESSLFELGKLLYFDLKETKLSIANLEKLIDNYPNSPRKPEAFYLLYLGQKELNGNFQQYTTLLNQEFPNSQYTYSVNNPTAASGNLAYLESSKKYEEAYNAYYNGKFELAKLLIKNTLQKYPLTRNTEKLILLEIMTIGKTENVEQFRERLEFFVDDASDPKLVELAKNMLSPLIAPITPKQALSDSTALDSTQMKENNLQITVNQAIEENSPYKINDDQTHIYLIILDPTKANEMKGLLGDLENFHAKNFGNARLRTGNMNLNRETAIFIISPFANAQKAIEYDKKFQEEFQAEGLTEEQKYNSLFISIQNFQELNKTKNIEEYRTFYKSNYK